MSGATGRPSLAAADVQSIAHGADQVPTGSLVLRHASGDIAHTCVCNSSHKLITECDKNTLANASTDSPLSTDILDIATCRETREWELDLTFSGVMDGARSQDQIVNMSGQKAQRSGFSKGASGRWVSQNLLEFAKEVSIQLCGCLKFCVGLFRTTQAQLPAAQVRVCSANRLTYCPVVDSLAPASCLHMPRRGRNFHDGGGGCSGTDTQRRDRRASPRRLRPRRRARRTNQGWNRRGDCCRPYQSWNSSASIRRSRRASS